MPQTESQQEIVTWVVSSRAAGKSENDIRQEMIRQGWSNEMINGVMEAATPLQQVDGTISYSLKKDVSSIGRMREGAFFNIPIGMAIAMAIMFFYGFISFITSSSLLSIFFIISALYFSYVFFALIKLKRKNDGITMTKYTYRQEDFSIETNLLSESFSWLDFSYFCDGYRLSRIIRHPNDPALLFLRKKKTTISELLVFFMKTPYVQLVVPISYEKIIRQVLEQRYGPERRPLVYR